MFDDDEDINEEVNESSSNDDADETPDEGAQASQPAEFENFGNEETPEEQEEEEEHKPNPNTVTVQPVQFASFEDLDQVQGPQNQNLNILLDVVRCLVK